MPSFRWMWLGNVVLWSVLCAALVVAMQVPLRYPLLVVGLLNMTVSLAHYFLSPTWRRRAARSETANAKLLRDRTAEP